MLLILLVVEITVIRSVAFATLNTYLSESKNCPFHKPCFCSGSRIICLGTDPDKNLILTSSGRQEASQSSWHELRIRIRNLRLIPRLSKNLRVNLLNVTHSNLTEISRRIFMPFLQLERLDLSYNQITQILNGQLVGLESLKELVLYHNEIFEIDENAFKYLVGLQKLFLNNNYLSTVPEALLDLKGLTHLYLSQNPIHRIESFAFRGLHSLSFLYLNGLQKSLEFEADSFCGIEKQSTYQDKPTVRIHFGLKFLSIMNNDIARFPPCVLHALTSTLLNLDLTGSKLHCDLTLCDNLSGLARQMSRSHFKFIPPKSECLFMKQLPRCNLTRMCWGNCHLPAQYSPVNSASTVTYGPLLLFVQYLALFWL